MHGPSLAVWGGGPTRGIRQRQLDGASVVAWLDADVAPLVESGAAFRTLAEVIGGDGIAGADTAARAWARVWARLPLAEGRSFREIAEWRGESLLWTVEAFLRTKTAGPRCARAAELCLRLIETVQPSEVEAFGLAAPDTLLLARACTACGVLFHGDPRGVRPLLTAPGTRKPGRWRRWFSGLAPRKAPPLLPKTAEGSSSDVLLVLVSRAEDKAVVAPLADAVAADRWMTTAFFDLSDLRGFATHRVLGATEEARRQLHEKLVRLRGTPAVAASYVHRGVGFADLAGCDLEIVLGDRLPRAVLTIESALELFSSARPSLVLLVVPEPDERRTLGMGAAAAGVPWAVLHTGAADAGEPTRADGGPHPAAAITWNPTEGAAAIVSRLREAARGTVSRP